MRSALAGIEVANGGNRGRKESGANTDYCFEAKGVVTYKFSVGPFEALIWAP